MLPGGGCMHLVDSVGRNKNIEYTCFLHEQAAVIAADGYAQYNNNIAAVLVTTGPGSTNAITGVAASWIDSTPIIVISGQVKRKDSLVGKGVRQMGIQEVDIISLVKPITKYAVTVNEPETIKYHLQKAFHLANTGRPGPVWIDIPLDVQGAYVDEKNLTEFKTDKIETKIKSGVLTNQVKQCIKLLNNSKRPVFLVGRGVRLSGAEEELRNVLYNLSIPVLTTWRMADFLPEDSRIYFGRPGAIASRWANYVQQNADLIIAIGSRLDLLQVGHDYPNFVREGKKVIVDIDENELKKIDTKIDVPVLENAKDFIIEFIKQFSHIKLDNNISEWLTRCRSWKAKYPVISPKYNKSSKFVNTYALIGVLSDLLTEKDLIVPGSSGSCAEITLQAFKVKQGQRIINSPGLGSMGFGLPQSIGVSLAGRGRRVICLVGDGGLQHNIQELETLKRLNIPLKLFILNNNGYASIRNTQNKFFDGNLVCCDPSSGLTLPDTCRIASAYGLNTKKISTRYNLKKNVSDVLKSEGVIVCEVFVEPDLQTVPKLSSEVNAGGSIISKPLEDLWPFLDKKEFENNMVIPVLKSGS